MPDWIYRLSDDQITAFIITAMICANLAASFVAWFVFRVRLHSSHVGVLSDAHRAVLTLTALVLAFSLVQAQANVREMQADVQREANTINAISSALELIDRSEGTELRTRLFEYTHRIIDREWPLLARGDYDRHSDEILSDMLHKVRALRQTDREDTQVLDGIIQNIQNLYSIGNMRRASASVRLAPSFWHAIVYLVLICILLAAVLPCTLPYLFGTTLMVTALAVLIALTIIVDVPFQGQSAVRPTELIRTLRLIGG